MLKLTTEQRSKIEALAERYGMCTVFMNVQVGIGPRGRGQMNVVYTSTRDVRPYAVRSESDWALANELKAIIG